ILAARQKRTVRQTFHRRAPSRFKAFGQQNLPSLFRPVHLLLPCRLSAIELRSLGIQRLLQVGDFHAQLFTLLFLCSSRQSQLRLVHPVIALPSGMVFAVAEERQKTVIILLCKRVELVVVALRAAERAPQPDGGG